MLNLSAAHLTQLRKRSPSKRLIWVDIGAGTGLLSLSLISYLPHLDLSYVRPQC